MEEREERSVDHKEEREMERENEPEFELVFTRELFNTSLMNR